VPDRGEYGDLWDFFDHALPVRAKHEKVVRMDDLTAAEINDGMLRWQEGGGQYPKAMHPAQPQYVFLNAPPAEDSIWKSPAVLTVLAVIAVAVALVVWKAMQDRDAQAWNPKDLYDDEDYDVPERSTRRLWTDLGEGFSLREREHCKHLLGMR